MKNTKMSQYKSVRDFKNRIERNYFHIVCVETMRVYAYESFAMKAQSVRECAKEDGFGRVTMVLPLFTKLNLN